MKNSAQFVELDMEKKKGEIQLHEIIGLRFCMGYPWV